MTSIIHPLPNGRYTDGFKYRPAIVAPDGTHIPAMWHEGQDIAAPIGTPIRAAHDGRVVSTYTDPTGGHMLTLETDDGVMRTRYLHMRELSRYKKGQRVKAGTIIGYVGDTGRYVTGPHLHFEVWINGRAVDPMPYLTKAQASSLAALLGDEMPWILVLQKKHYYLIQPRGTAKASAILLGAEANEQGLFNSLPVVPAYSAQFTMNDLKKNISGLRSGHLKPVK